MVGVLSSELCAWSLSLVGVFVVGVVWLAFYCRSGVVGVLLLVGVAWLDFFSRSWWSIFVVARGPRVEVAPERAVPFSILV